MLSITVLVARPHPRLTPRCRRPLRPTLPRRRRVPQPSAHAQVVYYYRFALQHDFFNRKILHRFSRLFLGVLVIKALEKGARARGLQGEGLSRLTARRRAARSLPLSPSPPRPAPTRPPPPLRPSLAGKEERIVDYAARKANVAAHEAALWDEELAAHSPDVAVAEASVERQRHLEWKLRQNDREWATLAQTYKFPFVPAPLK